MALEIKNLTVSIDGKKILDNVNLTIDNGINLLMGKNGSGKTTIARVISGDKKYEINGEILLDGKNINNLTPEERFKEGIFTSFQMPPELEGIKTSYFIKKAGEKINKIIFYKDIKDLAKKLGISELIKRELNKGFSGGERKKIELLQALLYDRKYNILDEIDSGLDIYSMEKFAEILNEFAKDHAILLITHNIDFAKKIKPKKIYGIKNGKIEKFKDLENAISLIGEDNGKN